MQLKLYLLARRANKNFQTYNWSMEKLSKIMFGDVWNSNAQEHYQIHVQEVSKTNNLPRAVLQPLMVRNTLNVKLFTWRVNK